MKVKIKRQVSPKEKPYWQIFDYDKKEEVTVVAILDYLNYSDDPKDSNQQIARRIRWECGCMQKMCGACAMVINHEPALACTVFINPTKVKTLILEPLTKFPVVSDLVVDRSSIMDHLKNAQMYRGISNNTASEEFPNQYMVAKCLKCGLCLEVCPNYVGAEGSFGGAVLANESFLLHSTSAERKKEIASQYKKHFDKGCSKSLACRDICPMKIPTLSSIGYMNRKR